MLKKTIKFKEKNYPISYKYDYKKIQPQQCRATIIVNGEEIYGLGVNEEVAYIDLEGILKSRV